MAVLAMTFGAVAQAWAVGRYVDRVFFDEVFAHLYELDEGQITVYTKNCVADDVSVVPVIHLFDRHQGVELAQSTHLGGGESLLAFLPPGGDERKVFLLVRAADATLRGSCDMYVEIPGRGYYEYFDVPVGAGELLELPEGDGEAVFGLRASEPGAGFNLAEGLMVFGFSGDGELMGLSKSAVNGGAILYGQDGMSRYMAAASDLAMDGGQAPVTGYGRLVVNDEKSGDTDGDGLSDALEEDIGTCWRDGGPNCEYAASPIDTDRDGLQDLHEVLGVWHLHQPLPTWGADPRHKDVFIETDFMAYDYAPKWVPPGLATSVDAHTWWDALRNAFDDGHPERTGNPDGQPGLRLHMDIGQDPPAGVYDLWRTSYGDWTHPYGAPEGVATSRQAVSGDWLYVDELTVGDPDITVVVYSGNEFHREDYVVDHTDREFMAQQIANDFDGEAWLRAEVRQDERLEYAGQPNLQRVVAFTPEEAGEHVWVEVWSGPASLAQPNELGSWMRERHYADDDYFQRRGLFFYGILQDHGGQSGPGLFDAEWTFEPVAHEIGHAFDLDHGGSTTINCQPHYHSIMGYGHETANIVELYDGAEPVTLDASNVSESDMAFPGFDFTTMAQLLPSWVSVHMYGPDTVDWNMNDVLESTNVRATICANRDRGDCAVFTEGRWGDDQLFRDQVAPDIVTGAPDLTGYLGTEGLMLYGFYVIDERLYWQTTPMDGAAEDGSCLDPLYAESSAHQCAQWSTEGQLQAFGVGSGVSAVTFDDQVFYAFATTSDAVAVFAYELKPSGTPVMGSQRVVLYSDAGVTAHTPELVVLTDQTGEPRLKLFYHSSTTNYFYAATYDSGADGFMEPVPQRSSTGLAIYGDGHPAVVSWPSTALAQGTGQDTVGCAVFPNIDSGVTVYCLDRTTDRWVDRSAVVFDNFSWAHQYPSCGTHYVEHSVVGHTNGGVCVPETTRDTSLVFHALRNGDGSRINDTDYPSQLLLTYVRYHDADSGTPQVMTHAPRMLRSNVVSLSSPPLNSPSFEFQDHVWLQNGWLGAAGDGSVNLYEDWELAATKGVASVWEWERTRVFFYPAADGTLDYPLTQQSDYTVLQTRLCRALRRLPEDVADEQCGAFE